VAVHIYTQALHRTTQITIEQHKKNNIRTTQIQTNVVECGPCPVFASFSLTAEEKARKDLSHFMTGTKVIGNRQYSQNVFTLLSLVMRSTWPNQFNLCFFNKPNYILSFQYVIDFLISFNSPVIVRFVGPNIFLKIFL
jgi:hypothetical protein